MYLSWSRKSKIEGELNLKRDPFYSGIGIYEDINGEKWDVKGIYGSCKTPFVQARQVSMFPHHYTTKPINNYGSKVWKPYTVKVVK